MKIIRWTLIVLGILSTHYDGIAQISEAQALLDSSRNVQENLALSDSLARAALLVYLDLEDAKGQIASLTRLSKTFNYHDQVDSALYYINEAVNLSELSHHKEEQASTAFDLAKLYEQLGKMHLADSTLKAGFIIYEEMKDSSGMSRCQYNLGVLHSHMGNHDAAIAHYFKSLEIEEPLGDAYMLNAVYQGIGIIYNKQNDYEKAEHYFTKGMEQAVIAKDTFGMMYLHNDFGILNKNRNNYKAAEEAYLKMLDLSKYPGYEHGERYALNNLGVLAYKMKEYKKGVGFGEKALTQWIDIGNPRSLSSSYNYLALNQAGLGKNKEALKNAKLALVNAKESGSLEKERDAMLSLSIITENLNRPAESLKKYKIYKSLYDSIYNEEKTGHIHGLEQKYEAEKKDKEIALLAKNAELAKVKNNRLWISLIATALLATMVFWILTWRIRKQKEIDAEKRKVAQLENERLQQELTFKQKELTSKVLQLCRKNEFLQSLDKQVKVLRMELEGSDRGQADKLSRQINTDMNADADWQQFLRSFESVHPAFNKELARKYPNFTAGEIRMACLFKMNLASKEIANLLNITAEGVKKTRYRMRKKMNISPQENLVEHFINLGSRDLAVA